PQPPAGARPASSDTNSSSNNPTKNGGIDSSSTEEERTTESTGRYRLSAAHNPNGIPNRIANNTLHATTDSVTAKSGRMMSATGRPPSTSEVPRSPWAS